MKKLFFFLLSYLYKHLTTPEIYQITPCLGPNLGITTSAS